MDSYHRDYMRNSRRENQQMIEILWGFLQKTDPHCEYSYYKGTNGILRWLINYLDRTHPGWQDIPKFQPLPKPELQGIREVSGEWALPKISSDSNDSK